jgi:hypothetical protein
MTEDKKRRAQKNLVARVLDGDGSASHTQRREAFSNTELSEPLHTLLSKVAENPTQISDDEIAAVKAAGFSEDQIFELVVCAAVGQSARQYEAGLAALDEAMTDKRGQRAP